VITIACVLREGGKVGYNATWVEKLQNAVSRNLTVPYRFICLSDCEVPCERIPLDDIGTGWWAKMQLFKPNALTGPTLFFDLDTVIFGDLNPLVEILLEQDRFVMWRDDTINISSSAIMYWNGDYSHIYENYIENANHYHETFSLKNQGLDRQVGDQAVISKIVPHVHINDLIPSEWIRLVSKHDERLDFSNSKIMIFKKVSSKPSTLPNHKIVKAHWN